LVFIPDVQLHSPKIKLQGGIAGQTSNLGFVTRVSYD